MTKKEMRLVSNLAKVFDEYEFYNDNLPVNDVYNVLEGVYNALPRELADELDLLCAPKDGD